MSTSHNGNNHITAPPFYVNSDGAVLWAHVEYTLCGCYECARADWRALDGATRSPFHQYLNTRRTLIRLVTPAENN